MTVISGIEIDHIVYKQNDIKLAIQNNDPIEDKLHVILVVSNPCLFAIRYILFKEFVKRIENEEKNVILYVVELAYGSQLFRVTEKNNPKHLQLRTDIPLWHKENMINLGVKYLLPPNFKAFAWIDADVEFENLTWATDALKLLNGSKDIIQLFGHCVDMDYNRETMMIRSSAGYQYSKGNKYHSSGNDYWHPGYAWAITRKAYEKMGGLYEMAILGSGDFIMLMSLLNKGHLSLNDQNSENYKKTVEDFQQKVAGLRFGYIPGTIRHHFHGNKKDRQYSQRWKILVENDYQPDLHIRKDEKGLLIPTEEFPQKLANEVFNYFLERKEDLYQIKN
uniref:Glycosyltransferase n=1 Tax=viral metagenome TaxID=1070528 RepID=A0A6C0LLY4_9ZZZZ